MLRRAKCLHGVIPGHGSLGQLQSTSRYRSYRKINSADDDGRRKREEGQDGYLQLHKSKGQHLLTNQRILDSIVRKSAIKPTDTVLEIGPGTGNLTLKLLEAAKSVVAVEIDKRMVEVLQKRVAECGVQDRLTVSQMVFMCLMKCLNQNFVLLRRVRLRCLIMRFAGYM